jgi:diguanylate cyclase (GGDEF)-like protein
VADKCPEMQSPLKHRFDPPLRKRLLWQDSLTPDTLISQDRGLMARSFGTLALVSTILEVLILLIHADPKRNYIGVEIAVVSGVVIGVICFLGYRRLPRWFFHVTLAYASALIAASATFEARAAAGVVILYLVWIVLLANLFFSARAALLHVLLASIALGIVLYVRDVDYWQNYAIGGLFVFGTAGLVVGRLRERVEEVAARLEQEAKTDALTGLANRRGFNQRCDLEIDRAEREEGPVSVIVCDLDLFKRVNDELGHDRGDVALRTAAIAIRDAVRKIDAVGRLGGEEFGIVLPGADVDEAMAVAERVRRGVKAAFTGHAVPLTISSGVATRIGGGSREGLLRSADHAMYEAKRLGRDRALTATNGHRPETAPPAYSLSASSTK